MNPSRRRLLQVGVGGAAVLAIGGLGLALQPTRTGSPPVTLQVLTPRQYAVLAAIAEAIVPPRAGLPTTDEVGVAAKIDDLLTRLHPGVGRELGQALLLLENALPGFLLDGRVRPLTALDLDARARALERWRLSRLPLRRQVYRGVAGLIGATYWADPRTWPWSGYQGPPAWVVQLRDAEPVDAW